MDDADVRLRLGPVVEDDWTLGLNEPALAERPLRRLCHEEHRRPVQAVLRFLQEQQSIEQLDRVVLIEEAVVDQPLVLVTGPAMQDGSLRQRHGKKPTRMLERRSRSLNGYSGASDRPPTCDLVKIGLSVWRRSRRARAKRWFGDLGHDDHCLLYT